jgi:hypothetical protein
MSEDGEPRFYRGKAGWIIIGIVAAIAVIFAVFVAFGSTIFPSGGPGTGVQSETGDESATSGPGHNTTQASEPIQSGNESITSSPLAPEQIPDSEVTYGRETSGVETSTIGEQSVNQTGNGTNDNLENPLSENITSLTGTAG